MDKREGDIPLIYPDIPPIYQKMTKNTKRRGEKMSPNELGSRISSNLRTPDHLGWIPGQKNIEKQIGPNLYV